MEKLITIATVAATLALGSQAASDEAAKMTVKMTTRDRAVAEQSTIQPAVQKGPNRPAVIAPDDKSISTKGVESTAEHPRAKPK
jgi:hypothetical protein